MVIYLHNKLYVIEISPYSLSRFLNNYKLIIRFFFLSVQVNQCHYFSKSKLQRDSEVSLLPQNNEGGAFPDQYIMGRYITISRSVRK